MLNCFKRRQEKQRKRNKGQIGKRENKNNSNFKPKSTDG